MQIDAVRAIRLYEWSCRPFYHANGHRIQRDRWRRYAYNAGILICIEYKLADYYIDELGVASYFELEWLDKLRELGVKEELASSSRSVPESYVASIYHAQILNFISSTVREQAIDAAELLEVGSALGRTCYDLIKSDIGLKHVTVVEPSVRFLSNFKKILIDGSGCEFVYVKGLKDTASIWFDSSQISNECSHIEFSTINEKFDCSLLDNQYDLSICLNVLDQCECPAKIVSGLQKATISGGLLFLSCSYQWSKKHLIRSSEITRDINEYFDEGWTKIAEDEHEYKHRVNDRYSQLFLSHIVGYKKI